jgi:two-component system, OmpR family, KDP operon response regulator KdpE
MFRRPSASLLVGILLEGRMEDLGGAVFVIDDDEGERELVIGLLERAGYTTMGFETGEDALAFRANHPPGVVILDIKLPGISG